MDMKNVDELWVPISEDTKTIEIMDEFEGRNPKNPRLYKRLVVKNKTRLFAHEGFLYYYYLVVERGQFSIRSKENYSGDITMTAFKTGNNEKLVKFFSKEISVEVALQYANKNMIFRVSKPFCLRAQNSENREGYGWEWNWSYGNGMVERYGTEYGETTTYQFSGAYIVKEAFNNRKNCSAPDCRFARYDENGKDIICVRCANNQTEKKQLTASHKMHNTNSELKKICEKCSGYKRETIFTRKGKYTRAQFEREFGNRK